MTDHYAQFLLKKGIKLQHTNQKLFWHNFKSFNDVQFDFELKNTDWNIILEADKKDIDISFNKFILRFNNLLQHNLHLLKNCQIKILLLCDANEKLVYQVFIENRACKYVGDLFLGKSTWTSLNPNYSQSEIKNYSVIFTP